MVFTPLHGFMLLMLITGSLNTLLMKFMVMQAVPIGPGAEAKGFDHPYFQTLLMMIGESLCLIAFFVSGQREQQQQKTNTNGKPPAPNWIFLIACVFDWTATTLVNCAYLLIAASVVQMTRGAVVIFTCLLSMAFLGRRQESHHALGVTLVFLGITLVSLSALLKPNPAGSVESGSGVLLGIAMCVGAQIFQASMLVYEEKIMSKYTVQPLQVVGMEGVFGCAIGVVLLLGLNGLHIESTPAALYQMKHSTPLLAAIIGSIFSIAFFNFSGVTVTQQASAVARSTIDVSRTIVIWAVELFLGWNSFSSLQLTGFVLLAAGTCIYNRILVIPGLKSAESEPLVS